MIIKIQAITYTKIIKIDVCAHVLFSEETAASRATTSGRKAHVCLKLCTSKQVFGFVDNIFMRFLAFCGDFSILMKGIRF